MRRLGFFLLACLLWAGSASAQAVNTNFFCKYDSTLTDAQIKGMPSTYPVIVPAPGANRMLVLQTAALRLTHAAGAYTGVDADVNLVITYGDYSAEASMVALDQVETDLENAATSPLVWVLSTGPLFHNGAVNNKVYPLTQPLANLNVDNQSFRLVMNNGSGVLGGGHPSNTMTTSVLYSIVNSTTGAFVACP